MKAATDPIIDKRYITNPDIIGAATLIHGYVALCGFGITRTRNHIVDAIPVKINPIFRKEVFLKKLISLEISLIMFFIPIEVLMMKMLPFEL